MKTSMRKTSSPWPDTVMSRAMLMGLVDWVGRHVNTPDAMVMLPVGKAGVGEVAQVLRALERARADKQKENVDYDR
jgi:hypothetical protein